MVFHERGFSSASCHSLVSLALKLGDDGTDDATLDAVRLDKDERALTFGSRLASKSSGRSRLALHGRGRVSGERTHGANGGEGERRAGHGTRDGRGQSTAKDRREHLVGKSGVGGVVGDDVAQAFHQNIGMNIEETVVSTKRGYPNGTVVVLDMIKI